MSYHLIISEDQRRYLTFLLEEAQMDGIPKNYAHAEDIDYHEIEYLDGCFQDLISDSDAINDLTL